MRTPLTAKRFVSALILAANTAALVLSLPLTGCGAPREGGAAVSSAASTQAPFVTPFETPFISSEAAAEISPAPTCEPSSSPTAEPTPSPSPEPSADEMIDAFIDGMSIEDKLGQLVMFGVGGVTEVSEESAAMIEEYRIGSVIFNGANVDRNDGSGGFDSMAALIEELNGLDPNGIPRLYSADVEGGNVQRFAWEPSLYSALKLGSMGEEAAYGQFLYVGERLRGIGINLDLAPVMDVSPDPLGTFLGSRIISADPETAGSIGAAMINGLHDGGCLATAKHFPGHGGTDADSHKGTPVVEKTEEELMGYDLLPFAAAIDAGVDCVMTAHIIYPAFDGENAASLSPAIITGVLRERLGFDGLVISDDFLMDGLRQNCPIAEAAIRFILSGGDLILCGAEYGSQTEIMESLYAAFEDGRLTESRVNESVHRVLYAKYRLGIWEP